MTESVSGAAARFRRGNVLGVGVHEVDIPRTTEAVVEAARERRKGYVCVTGAHGVIESQRDAGLRDILNRAFLNVPDGMPLVWVCRRQGLAGIGRVYGPELMHALCARSVREGLTHFLFGGAPGVAERLKERLESAWPGIRIVGTCTPPFRPLNEAEREDLRRTVAAARPHLFWVGISTPKQERFMAEFLPELDVGVMLGVGAAFDIHAGLQRDAPDWIKRSGLQWFYRLCCEPRRLWRRYAVIVPSFLWLWFLQMTGLRRFRL